jgi:hypothetical protein
MKTFKEYLSESVKTYPFRIKIAGNVTTEDEGFIKYALDKFSIAEFKKVGKTPIQSLPLDFPKVRNAEVTVFEVSTHYPTTPQELTDKLLMCLKRPLEEIVVRNPNEPLEEYQAPREKRKGALLNDGEMSEAVSQPFDSFWGTNYNAQFLKQLHADAEARRKARGEEIPGGTADEVMKHPGQTLNDFPQNNNSPIQQSDYDPRKK